MEGADDQDRGCIAQRDRGTIETRARNKMDRHSIQNFRRTCYAIDIRAGPRTRRYRTTVKQDDTPYCRIVSTNDAYIMDVYESFHRKTVSTVLLIISMSKHVQPL